MQVDAQVGRRGRGGERGGGGDDDGFSKRGTKRGASDSNLTDDERFDLERFEKRLRLLSLRNTEHNGNDKSHLYTPISNNASPTAEPSTHPRSQTPLEGGMQVDDTPNRVYIHDLDAELADDSSDGGEERLIFLPDIEKHFSRLPQQVLAGGADEGNRELVLYDVPRSLTVNEGHDSVRKAIIEARQRAREKVMEESRLQDLERVSSHSDDTTDGATETAHWYNGGFGGDFEVDPDAMDTG